jgi:predicted transcriptional regulator
MKDDNKILNRVLCVALFCYACFMIYLMTKVMINSQKLTEQNISDPKKKGTHKTTKQVCCTNQKIHNLILAILCLNYAIAFMSIMFLVMDSTGACYYPQKSGEKKFVGFDNQMIILFVISLANMILFGFLNSSFKAVDSKYCDDSSRSTKQFVKKCLISYSISTMILLILGITYRYFTHEDRMSNEDREKYRTKKEKDAQERKDKENKINEALKKEREYKKQIEEQRQQKLLAKKQELEDLKKIKANIDKQQQLEKEIEKQRKRDNTPGLFDRFKTDPDEQQRRLEEQIALLKKQATQDRVLDQKRPIPPPPVPQRPVRPKVLDQKRPIPAPPVQLPINEDNEE